MMKSDDFLLMLGPQLHLRTFQGIIKASKCPPVDPISPSVMCSTKILSVEIGCMTTLIPPSAFIPHCTGTTRPKIVVLTFGGKSHFTVKWQKEPLNVKKEGLQAQWWNHLPSTDVACSIQTLPFTHSLVTPYSVYSCPLSSYYILTTCEVHLNWVDLTHRNSDG